MADLLELHRRPGSTLLANAAQVVLSTMFNFAVEMEYLPANPASGLSKRGRYRPGERELTSGEISSFFEALAGSNEPRFKADLYRIQLFTAARPGEGVLSLESTKARTCSSGFFVRNTRKDTPALTGRCAQDFEGNEVPAKGMGFSVSCHHRAGREIQSGGDDQEVVRAVSVGDQTIHAPRLEKNSSYSFGQVGGARFIISKILTIPTSTRPQPTIDTPTWRRNGLHWNYGRSTWGLWLGQNEISSRALCQCVRISHHVVFSESHVPEQSNYVSLPQFIRNRLKLL